jgi:hypothetical protein
MRYVLIVVGLLSVLLGYLMIVGPDPIAASRGPVLAQAGAIFLGVGLATVDIVKAIEAKRP